MDLNKIFVGTHHHVKNYVLTKLKNLWRCSILEISNDAHMIYFTSISSAPFHQLKRSDSC